MNPIYYPKLTILTENVSVKKITKIWKNNNYLKNVNYLKRNFKNKNVTKSMKRGKGISMEVMHNKIFLYYTAYVHNYPSSLTFELLNWLKFNWNINIIIKKNLNKSFIIKNYI